MDGAMEEFQPKKKQNAANRGGEISAVERQKELGRIVPRRPVPEMLPVEQSEERNVVVVGSTYLVEMVEHTLFNGKGDYSDNQRHFLRQGTQVVIDESKVIISRRGPNQEFFREEDRERGTRIYHWFHVKSVGGQDVSNENFYIREGTFREEALLMGRILSPPSGGVRPSIAAKPGEKQRPFVGVWHERKEGQDILTPEQRSLNRLARGEWVTLTDDTNTKTPHLAMMVFKGKIYVAGNTDRAVPYEVVQGKILDKLKELIKKTQSDRLKRKRQKMEKKFIKIAEGQYYSEQYQSNEIMATIKKAIQDPNGVIEIIEAKHVGETAQGSAPIHGEMLFLDMLYDEYKALGKRDRQAKRRRLKKIFAGGNLQDCIFCHWAFDIFNRVIGSQLGVMVVSSGTHGQIPRSWRIPRWLISEKDARDMLQHRIGNDKGYNIIDMNGYWVLTYSKSVSMKDTMLPESDSE